jgi:hypothetical protein
MSIVVEIMILLFKILLLRLCFCCFVLINLTQYVSLGLNPEVDLKEPDQVEVVEGQRNLESMLDESS